MTWMTGNQCFHVAIAVPSTLVKQKIACWDWPLYGNFEMKHELSAHEMRHRFSVSQAHISGHNQTKMSHYKLSGKSETESSLHQADFLRVRYWPAPARVLWEGQRTPLRGPTGLFRSCGPAHVVETGKGVISQHCNFCSWQFARKNLIFLPSLFNFVSTSKGHSVQCDVDD